MRRQYLQRDVIERELIVEKEVNELIRVERELEQTSKLTRQAQNERNHLLEQWENAANFLNANQKDSQKIVDVSSIFLKMLWKRKIYFHIFPIIGNQSN